MKVFLLTYHLFMSLFLGGGVMLSVASYFKGGGWGKEILKSLPQWKWATLIWVLPLILIFFSIPTLYPWELFEGNKALYFKDLFVIIRQVIYFFALILALQNMERRPGVSVIIYFLVGTFFAYDWGLSLEREWYSNLYGIIYLTSGALASMALMLLTSGELSEKENQDLINLYITAALFWLYLEFCQFLIVWMGNLPREMSWYVPRLRGRMLFLFILVPLLKVIPAVMLATQKKLRSNRKMVKISMILSLVSFLLEMIWFIWPSLKGET